jgi:hypothetical protein
VRLFLHVVACQPLIHLVGTRVQVPRIDVEEVLQRVCRSNEARVDAIRFAERFIDCLGLELKCPGIVGSFISKLRERYPP